MESKRELLKILGPHLKRYGGPTTVFRGEKVAYASDSRGSTFWSASVTAANVYSAGGYGYFTSATFQIGMYVYFEKRTSLEFCEFCDELAKFAMDVGCELICSTTDEWVKTNYGRISWPGDFYVHCVDALIDAGLWPKAIRYTILGNDWKVYAYTHQAAEVIVHNLVQLLKYEQEYYRERRPKVDCWRKKAKTKLSKSNESK